MKRKSLQVFDGDGACPDEVKRDWEGKTFRVEVGNFDISIQEGTLTINSPAWTTMGILVELETQVDLRAHLKMPKLTINLIWGGAEYQAKKLTKITFSGATIQLHCEPDFLGVHDA